MTDATEVQFVDSPSAFERPTVGDLLDAQEAELAALREWKAKAEKALREIQWKAGDAGDVNYCPACGCCGDPLAGRGHAPDCALAELLGDKTP
jgi:hypothetical protein